MQLCFTEQGVSTQPLWWTVVLISKGGDNYWGISPLEIIWNVIESIVNWRIASKVTFQASLHDFVANQRTGRVYIEAKLLYQMLQVVQKTLYYIFLDLHKAYNSVDWEQLLAILEGYRVGPNTLGLLLFYWKTNAV